MHTPLHADMTLQELLSHESGIFGDYLLLSFVPQGDKTEINLKSTGTHPIVYSVTVANAADLDVQGLLFNAASR